MLIFESFYLSNNTYIIESTVLNIYDDDNNNNNNNNNNKCLSAFRMISEGSCED